MMAQDKKIYINEYSYTWLKRGFDWVYAKEIKKSKGAPKSGEWVEIIAPSGHSMGWGICSSGNIRCRRLSRDKVKLPELLAQRLKEARARRPYFSNQQAWRWVHAENDSLPGIRIDIWARQCSITLADSSLKSLLKPLCKEIILQEGCTGIHGFVRTGSKVDNLGCLHGQTHGCWVEEHGLKYWVEPHRSPDAGLFGDMRELRAWLQPYFKHKDVLNLFCFTGAFSVSAAAASAKSVHSVDLSSVYIDWTRKNMVENNIAIDEHHFSADDALKSLDRFRRKKVQFDIVIADPPSFSHGEKVWSVERDLSGLVLRCLRVLKPQGMLVIATNNGKISPKDFAKAIIDASYKEGRPIRILKQYDTSIDYPAALSFPESRYLKCWVLQA